MTGEAPLRWGLIGTGFIANAFAENLTLTASGRVVAIGSRRRESAERFGENFGIPNRHTSYEALVQDPEVDVVYVATPHPMHYANTLLALEAGKPVLVEKSFTMNSSEARGLVEVARAKGLFLMEAMWTRCLPHIREIRRLLAAGHLGDVTTVMVDLGKSFEKDPTSRLFAPELGGSALLDLGVYVVSFASMILGTPSHVLALIEPTFTGVDGQTSMLFGYPNGAQALLSCSVFAVTPTRAVIVGTDARIEVDFEFFAPTTFSLISNDGSRVRFEPAHSEGTAHAGGLRYEADEVARCIRSGLLESPLMPLDETIAIMETMDKVLALAQRSSHGDIS